MVTVPARRKLVTLLFCDVTGSTALGERMDAESVRDVMSEYFREMRAAIEGNGGVIEKFIGDAIMAVFGIPVSHEDDATRAVRAACDMVERLTGLNERLQKRFDCRLDHRIGVNTGDVMVGGPIGGETFATGDAVNVTARLEQAASPGEILIGESTHRLVGALIRANRVMPIAAKGKGVPIVAFRLDSMAPQMPPAPRGLSGFVGRNAQLERLRQVNRACIEERHSTFVLLVGEPGVGKSRLVDVFCAELAPEASLYAGRCLSYGAGISYWPVSEIVRQASGILEADPREQALARLEGKVASQGQSERIASLLARAIGLEEGIASIDEIRWAAGRFIEGLAQTGQLVVVFDDLHWADAPLLDLIEHVARSARDSPILLLGLARPEVLDARPLLGDEVIQLDPLDDIASSDLLRHLLKGSNVDKERRSQLLATAGGNPLFLEELVAALRDERGGHLDTEVAGIPPDVAALAVPTSIQGLLEARLDRLPDDERQVVERGSVEGQVFHQGLVEYLSDASSRGGASAALDRLAQKGFLQPARPDFADQTAFRFRHILMRDAAYSTTPKKVRARFHEGFVDWAELAAGDRQSEFEEILGHHLEQAHLHLSALGPIDDHGRALADRAAEKLASAGRRSFARGNVPGASDLLRRASSLIGETGDRVPVLVDLAEVLARAGELAGATRISADVVEMAEAAGDQVSRAYAKLSYLMTAVFPFVHHWVPHEDALEEIGSAIKVFEEAGDERGLARAYATMDLEDQTAGRGDRMRSALETSLECARRASLEREEAWALGRLCITSVWDATPVEEAAERCHAVIANADDRPLTMAQAHMSLAGLTAMGGDIEGGRQRLALVHDIHRELGSPMQAVAHTAPMTAYIGFWSGDPDAAELAVRPVLEAVERFGAPSLIRWLAALLADALYGKGELEDAELVSRKALGGVPADHRQAQIDGRIPRSRILAGLGRIEEGERLAREAVTIARETHFLLHRTMALVALADVLILQKKWAEAAATIRTAFEVTGRKHAPGLTAYVSSREPFLRSHL